MANYLWARGTARIWFAQGNLFLAAHSINEEKRKVTLFFGDGEERRAVSGYGPTVRDAYRAAYRRMRLARHDVGALLAERGRLLPITEETVLTAHDPARRLQRRAALCAARRQMRERGLTNAATLAALLTALNVRLDRARDESMALRHLLGTKDLLAALDVLVEQATHAQGLALAEFRAIQAEGRCQALQAGQARLQAEVDALRAQNAADGIRLPVSPAPVA